MKKIKVMLMSLVLFAVVGGALAFKAKFDTDFCITQADAWSADLTCPDLRQSTFDNSVGANKIYFTTTPQSGACPSTIKCLNSPKVSLIQD